MRPGVPAPGLAAYAALAFPLAMAALPVYLHAPKFYAERGGLSLAAIGGILLAVRALDAVQDPLLGRWSDRAQARGVGREGFIVAAVACLAAGMLALFHPPPAAAGWAGVWLAASLALSYLGFSLGTIAYFAWGAALTDDTHQRTRVTAARSAAGLAGVLTAAALPQLLAGEGDAGEGLRSFSLLYVPILVVAAALTLFGTPRVVVSAPGPAPRPLLSELFAPLANVRFRWLLAVFVASGVASAIPATLILFYVQDVLGRTDLSGVFLGLYFVCGALAMPLWVRVSVRSGKKGAWLIAMGMSIAAFVWAFVLGEGDAVAFGMVCALSGIAYGAELAIPPSLVADVVDDDPAARESRPDGSYFGFWQLAEKANLALAAGVALPLLGWAGYSPGMPQLPMGNLSAMYALIPCLVKVGAVAVLWLAPLGPRVAEVRRVTA